MKEKSIINQKNLERIPKFILLLDGSKGSGKTTIGTALKNRLQNAELLSLDEIRRAIPNASATAEYNQMAFNKLLQKLRQVILSGNSVIIDCGVTKEKLSSLEEVAKILEVKLHKYFLTASPEILLNRVVKRDIKNGKITNKERFDYVYNILRSKDFIGYTEIDTYTLSPKEITEEMLRSVSNHEL